MEVKKLSTLKLKLINPTARHSHRKWQHPLSLGSFIIYVPVKHKSSYQAPILNLKYTIGWLKLQRHPEVHLLKNFGLPKWKTELLQKKNRETIKKKKSFRFQKKKKKKVFFSEFSWESDSSKSLPEKKEQQQFFSFIHGNCDPGKSFPPLDEKLEKRAKLKTERKLFK